MAPHAQTITRYGIQLQRLTRSLLELVRQWRNSDFVREQMVFQELISQEQQIRWFESLDPNRDYYYVVFVEENPAGLVNLKNVKDGSAEGGIFIGNCDYKGGTVAMQSLLAMYEFGFTELALETISATIRRQNIQAERLNTAIGFRPEEKQLCANTQSWLVSKEHFFSKTAAVRSFFLGSSGNFVEASRID